jgi:hypothetical protein
MRYESELGGKNVKGKEVLDGGTEDLQRLVIKVC